MMCSPIPAAVAQRPQQPRDRDGFRNRVTLTFRPLGQCMPSCHSVYMHQVWCW